jgi:hypothetical protein
MLIAYQWAQLCVVVQVWGSHTGDGPAETNPKTASEKGKAERPQNGKTEP